MKGTLRFLGRYIAKVKLPLALGVLTTLVSVGLTLYTPVLFGRAIDEMVGVGQVDFGVIATLSWQTAVMIAVNVLCQWVSGVCFNNLTFRITKDMRVDMMAKLMRLPLSYLDTHRQGETLGRITSDVETVADGLLMGFSQLVSGVATILATLVFMFVINWLIALAVVVLTPLSLFVARFIARRIHSGFARQAETRAKQTGYVNEMFTHQKTVGAYLGEARAAKEFEEINGEWEKVATKAVFYSSLTNPSTRLVNAIVYAAVAALGALSVTGAISLAEGLTVGGMSIMLSYANQYTKPFNEISGVITELQNAFVCCDRVRELLDAAEETDEPNATRLVSPRGDIDVKDVSFAYDPHRPLIEHLDLRVQAGERVAIVGPTGCGKTTLINLLMRFYDVDRGEIDVDGKDIRTLTRPSLRYYYGMVLQETWIRHATVADNIAIGKPDATREEIEQAAKEVYADSFIRRLPQGYDTVIDDDGSLSVGQKQLLCIARVMLIKPPMLILDEATSSIDTRTEIKIQKAFGTLMQGKTSFVVAHRLQTVMDADVILVMKDGHVVETGTHDALMAQRGFYYTLFNSGLN